MQSENRKAKKTSSGFTIVELLMVIGIISVLITITVSAITNSIKSARAQKAKALCTLVAQGIATYYAQKDEWPLSGLEDKTANADEDGNKSSNKPKVLYRLEESEVQQVVLELVNQTKQGSPVMDVSGLFVAKQGVKQGMDFTSAVRGTKKHPEGIRLANMRFGYPDPSTGEFRQFKMMYSPATESVKVSQQ